MHSPSVRRPRPVRFAALALAAAFVTFVFPSCRQATEPSDLPAPTFSGRWLGKTWEGRAVVLRYTKPVNDSLFVWGERTATSSGFVDEILSFRILFRGVGTYVLGARDVEVRELVGGDVIVATYGGVGVEAGAVQITSYDERTGRVEGTVRFDARLTGASASEPIVHFEEGQFRAAITVVP